MAQNSPTQVPLYQSLLNQQLFNGDPNNPFAQLDIMESPVATTTKRRITRFQKAQRELSAENSIDEKVPVSRFFFPCDSEKAIELLGWWNPMLNGVPKTPAMTLLMGVPSATSYQGHQWKCCGLMYFTPSVMGRKRTRARTTLAGLRLLRHWGTKHPKFQKFYEAFWTKGAERAITSDCMDFNLGILPAWFENERTMDIRYRERHDKAQALAAKIRNEARRKAMTQQLYSMQSQAPRKEYEEMLRMMQAQQFGVAQQSAMAQGLALSANDQADAVSMMMAKQAEIEKYHQAQMLMAQADINQNFAQKLKDKVAGWIKPTI